MRRETRDVFLLYAQNIFYIGVFVQGDCFWHFGSVCQKIRHIFFVFVQGGLRFVKKKDIQNRVCASFPFNGLMTIGSAGWENQHFVSFVNHLHKNIKYAPPPASANSFIYIIDIYQYIYYINERVSRCWGYGILLSQLSEWVSERIMYIFTK